MNGRDDELFESVKQLRGVNAYKNTFEKLMQIMDNWLLQHKKTERADQHKLYCNNYNIVDLEYRSKNQGQVDMVIYENNKLYVVELKSGLGAISGSASLYKHYRDVQKMLELHKITFLRSMQEIISVRNSLGFLNLENIQDDIEIEMLFLFVNFNPKSTLIKKEKEKIAPIRTLDAKILFLDSSDETLDLSKASDFFLY